jgi:hypothetical protein
MTRYEIADRQVFDQAVEEQRDDTRDDYDDGWFCVRTNPWPCPADGCTFVALYMTAAHQIVVFPGEDDRRLFAQARYAREAGRNPKIVRYERSFGPCIPVDVWMTIGRPVHGRRPEPEGWDNRGGLL